MATNNDTLVNVVENVVKNTTNVSTPEGKVVAYSSLVLMALFPIFYGSFRSVTFHKDQKVRHMLYY